MLITATVILAGLSADVRRQSFLESYVNDNSNYQIEYVQNDTQFSNDFYLDINSESKRIEILNELESEIINKDVKRNAVDIIRNLSALFLMNFNINNLYESSYGTAILEYEIDNSNFTIEIGEKSFGYFSEKDGDYLKIIEEVLISDKYDERDVIIGNLNKDFIDFYYSL